ncbi:MAG: DUF45 domain-containing protein [Clostridia bacterium]|nr:DUF45 domain-containing protein [Clostridia bacterium]
MGLFSKTNQVISYTVDKNFTGNLAISIVDGQVAISAPWYVSNRKINQVISDKKNWILQKLAEYDEKNNAKKSLLEKKTVKVFGEDYGLKISYKLIRSPELNLDNKTIMINLPVKYRNIDNTKIVSVILDKFYNRLVEKELEQVMEKNRINLKLAPNDYKLQKMDGVLGRFLEDTKVILINPEIAKYNKDILEYVVLHEFCHLKYKTHGKNFYKMIEKYIPNYQEIERKIKGMY